LFFLSGGLFADAMKTRAYQKSIDLGLPEKMVTKLTGSAQAPGQSKGLFVQLAGPSLLVFLGTLMRFAGEIVQFTESIFTAH
jgi:hypothetical protein